VRIVVTGATGFAGGATLTPAARRRPGQPGDLLCRPSDADERQTLALGEVEKSFLFRVARGRSRVRWFASPAGRRGISGSGVRRAL
jgi:nucleoside-diphosphate-sugar epimerase